MNFLEQLAAEWYGYKGRFVRTNCRARKRPRGGWDVELDVLAFGLQDGELIHLEASGDADLWRQRKARFLKKFILDKQEYESIVGGTVRSVRKIALVGYAESTRANLNWGNDIEVMLIPHFVQGIICELKKKDFMREAVPESFPLLRAIQLGVSVVDAQGQSDTA